MAAEPPLGESSSEILIHKLYIKDISFESPNTPVIFNEDWQPEVDINVQNSGRKVGARVWEVVLSVPVTARVGENVGFLVEVHQAGLFALNVPDDDAAKPLIGATIPGILYPYARECVSELSTRGGFPPLILTVADFDAIYASQTHAGILSS